MEAELAQPSAGSPLAVVRSAWVLAAERVVGQAAASGPLEPKQEPVSTLFTAATLE